MQEHIADDPNVEDWINGVSFVQTTETIYRNNAVWAEYEPIVNELERLQRELEDLVSATPTPGPGEDALGDAGSVLFAPAGEDSLGEATASADVAAIERRLGELQRQAEAVFAKYADDVEVWHFRALDPEDEIQPIVAEVAPDGLPNEPRPLGAGASPQKKAAWVRRQKAWMDQMATYALEINLRCVERACLKVVVAGDEKPGPSLAGLRALRGRPYGKRHFEQLVAAVERISLKEVEFPAPHREGA